jgi:hypothetical protein
MGLRQNNLAWLLGEAGLSSNPSRIPGLTRESFGDGWARIAQDVYRRLGGCLTEFPLRIGSWDLQIGDVAIELDEECHFNRYRFITLESSVYQTLPSFPITLYKSFSSEHEADCRSAASRGKFWSTPSASVQFGPSSCPGDLSAPGSSRWKQRAFYDFLKDLCSLASGFRLARLSIWDAVVVGNKQLFINDVLLRPSPRATSAIVKLIETRAETILG